MKIVIYSLLISIVFLGCSSKQYFEPESVNGSYDIELEKLDSSIYDFTPNGVTLEDHTFISQSGSIDINESKKYNFINEVDGVVLASDDNATLLIKTKNSIDKIKFDKNIISASIKNNIIALGFIDNSIAIFDNKSKKTLFKEYFTHSFVNDVKIANPIFLNTVLLYPTLDGKIIVIGLKDNKIIKTINIDPQNDINNIIFLESIGDTLIAATSNKIFTFNEQRVNIKDLDVKFVTIKNKYIYVSTLDGEIIKFDQSLNKIVNKKFKFAKFLALVSGEYIYALESQEFLIRLDENLSEVRVYDFSFDEEEKVTSIKNKLYFEDEYIILK